MARRPVIHIIAVGSAAGPARCMAAWSCRPGAPECTVGAPGVGDTVIPGGLSQESVVSGFGKDGADFFSQLFFRFAKAPEPWVTLRIFCMPGAAKER